MSSSLRERLARLPSGAAASGESELARLEQRLLGSVAEELPLKERLQRLAAVAAHGRGSRATLEPAAGPAAWPPIEELVQGLRVQNERGEFFLAESDQHLDSFHGEVPLSRLRCLSPASLVVLSGEPELSAFPLEGTAFLDTETTGLAGGTGTAAFLIGVGWVDGARFRVRQYFMRDYHEEAALLQGLAADLVRFRALVTFNGRLFDVPLLESRYRLARGRFPLEAVPHLDLLPPARRLWQARLESCRLQSLERELLGVTRRGDVAGEAIPRVYFDYVRRRDARELARVFEHNRLDVVSLAALVVHACQWLEPGRAEDPRDVVSLARVFERARLPERSASEYRRVLASADRVSRLAALLWLGARAKRAGEQAAALALWEQAAALGDALALRELAMHHEHRERDYAAALEVVELGLDGAGAPGWPRPQRLARDFERRRQRLLAKLARGRAASPAPS